jgi:hypothetical protein
LLRLFAIFSDSTADRFGESEQACRFNKTYIDISNEQKFDLLISNLKFLPLEQIFGICNGLAAGSLVTYKVIPISTSLGMLQFIEKTSTLNDLVPKLTEKENLLIGRNVDVLVKEDLGKSLNEDSNSKRARFQKEVVDEALNGGFQLRDTFLRLTTSYQGFFALRKNFMTSHG